MLTGCFVLHYYFDVYDWRESLLIRGVSREDALMTFPQPGDLAGDPTLLVMISGNSQTGRDSLANLVVHKIKRATNEKPVVVSVRLGFDAKSNALNTATLFVDAFEIDAERHRRGMKPELAEPHAEVGDGRFIGNGRMGVVA